MLILRSKGLIFFIAAAHQTVTGRACDDGGVSLYCWDGHVDFNFFLLYLSLHLFLYCSVRVGVRPLACPIIIFSFVTLCFVQFRYSHYFPLYSSYIDILTTLFVCITSADIISSSFFASVPARSSSIKTA